MNFTYQSGDVPDEEIIDYDFPLESIARKMYRGCWGMNAMQPRRTGDFSRDLNFIEEYEVDGVVGMFVASCRAAANLYDTWRQLGERLKLRGLRVPMLGIEADMVDTRTYSDALVKEQLRAFMDTVATAKKEKIQRLF